MTRRLSSRPGYTLLEVTLVTALLGVMAALAYPAIDGMSGQHRLTASVDAVRAAWAQGRSRAIEEGRPYRFAFSGPGHYRLAPEQPDYWSGSVPPDSSRQVLEGDLPPGITFGTRPGSSSGQGSSGEWSSLAVFLPDGTAREDVQLLFQVKGTPRTVLQLRAMTGAVTVHTASGG